jgi:hypothetical protein
MSLKRGPEVLVVRRDAVTGQWIGATGNGGDPARCIVLMYSSATPDPELVTDAPPQVIDVSAQR